MFFVWLKECKKRWAVHRMVRIGLRVRLNLLHFNKIKFNLFWFEYEEICWNNVEIHFNECIVFYVVWLSHWAYRMKKWEREKTLRFKLECTIRGCVRVCSSWWFLVKTSSDIPLIDQNLRSPFGRIQKLIIIQMKMKMKAHQFLNLHISIIFYLLRKWCWCVSYVLSTDFIHLIQMILHLFFTSNK